ncbi:MAG: VWA domain-containing protein [Planctomycetes bacterium]|nr:VWA domain-containing protein [Planctomycetota bacterium]
MTGFAWWGYTLLDPWLLLLAPAGLLAWLWRWSRPRAALPTAAVSLFADLPRTVRQRLAFLPLLAKVLAALVLSVALARPVLREVAPNRQQGIDIVLVVDISSSMQIDDMDREVSVRRIDAARQRAEAFAAARPHDRIAFVTFARYAELRCPPTLDNRALGAFLRSLDTVESGCEIDATAVGTGLAKAVGVLQKSSAKSKVVVMLTDGENNVADILPADAAKLAADAGVRVHAIGLGNGTPTLLGGFQPLEFTELRGIAEHTGGEFFQPKSDRDLAAVYQRIDELEKTELEDPRYRLTDVYAWPLAAGLLLLGAALLLETLWLRRVP